MQTISNILFVLLFTWGCKPTSNSDSEVKIINGQIVSDSDPALFSTVFLQSSGGESCTGTLIGPNHISTAAHCIAEGSRVAIIGYGKEKKALAGIQNIRHKIHASFEKQMNDQTKDIAVVVFDGTLPAELRPVPVARDGEFTAGEEVIFAGYGVTSSGQAGDVDGMLRVVRSKIAEIDSENGEIYNQANGKGVCFGDSGGPMYIESGTSSLKVIGATSRVMPPCETGDSISTSLPFYRTWMANSFNSLGKPLNYLTNGSEPDWSNTAKIKIDLNTLLP